MERGRRRGVVGVVGLVVVGLMAAGGFIFVRALWWSLRPTPEFPTVAARPVAGVQGTLAFLRPFPDDDCIWTVSVAAGAPRKVACLGDHAGALEWLPDGRIQSTAYKGGEGTSPTRRWIVDPRTGAVVTVPASEIPPPRPQPERVRGPRGEVVTSTSRRGRLTVRLTAEGRTRTLLSVAAPDTFTLGRPTWGPDGTWFVAKDDLDRLLLVTTAEPSATRVLVEGGWGEVVAGTAAADG